MSDKMPVKQKWSQRMAAIEDLKFNSVSEVMRMWPAQADWISKNKNITGAEVLDLMDADMLKKPDQ